MLAVEVVMRAVVLVVVMLASGCTTVTPHGKAVQTAAYGGGFMAAGTVQVAGAAVTGLGAAAVLSSASAPPVVKDTAQSIAISSAVTAGLGVGLFFIGALVMGTTTEQLDTVPAHRHREPAPARKTPSGNPYGYQ